MKILVSDVCLPDPLIDSFRVSFGFSNQKNPSIYDLVDNLPEKLLLSLVRKFIDSYILYTLKLYIFAPVGWFGIRLFPFGFRPIFRRTVSFREGKSNFQG